MAAQIAPDPSADPPHRPLHAPDRRLDLAFVALAQVPADTFLHCLHGEAGPTELPVVLAERLPHARWIPADAHPLTFVDPSDHLRVHQAWLEACHGPERVARTTVRTVQPLPAGPGGGPGPVGTYHLQLIDLVGAAGIDAVVVTLDPAPATADADRVVTPPPRGTASFRLEIDHEGAILTATDSVGTLLGREVDDLVGTSLGQLLHPDDRETARGAWQDVLAVPEQSQTVRVRLHLGDGRWRWFSSTAWNALADPETHAVLTEFHDIEDLVEAELALQASELGFRTLAESLPVGVAVLDQRGLVQFANHRLVTLLGAIGLIGPDAPIDMPEPAGPGFTMSWTDLVAPVLATEVTDLVEPRDPTGPPVSRQVEVPGPDGGVHLLVQAVTIGEADGRQVIVSVQDVSDEVRTGRAHAHLVQVVDEVTDAVIVARIGGPITYLNQAARRFLGDAVGRELQEFMDPGLIAITETVVAESIVRLEAWSGDLDLADLDGSVHTMATTVSPVLDASRSVLHVGITMRDVTARRAHERELSRLARHDPLTGLPNRLAIMERIDAARDAGRPDDEVAVCFIDLDNLKVVNDGLGHSAGDRLLEAVARELAAIAPPHGVGRFGGDEFVVVLEHADDHAALAQAEAYLGAIGHAAVSGVANHVTASIGVATCRRGDIDAEALIRDADAAMYAAKRQGKSRCARFDGRLREQVSRRFLVESSLRSAIATDELTVAFQPIVSLADGAVTGAEALCRWEDVSPAEFIPIAEDSGLVVPLGAFVLAETLSAGARLRASAPHLGALRLGVNVSARELHEPDFAARTLEAIEASEVPAAEVVLELTESVLIDPSEEVDRTLDALRQAGVALALDDFGSGYSSLTYLRRYPIDVLKLDITYTQAMVTDPETLVIVEALASMAQRLGIDIVAEGIETAEQLAVVRDLGVTWGQGYLLGRPAPLDEHLASGLPPLGSITPRR